MNIKGENDAGNMFIFVLAIEDKTDKQAKRHSLFSYIYHYIERETRFGEFVNDLQKYSSK